MGLKEIVLGTAVGVGSLLGVGEARGEYISSTSDYSVNVSHLIEDFDESGDGVLESCLNYQITPLNGNDIGSVRISGENAGIYEFELPEGWSKTEEGTTLIFKAGQGYELDDTATFKTFSNYTGVAEGVMAIEDSMKESLDSTNVLTHSSTTAPEPNTLRGALILITSLAGAYAVRKGLHKK